MCWAEGGRGERHLAERRHRQPGWPGQHQDERDVNPVTIGLPGGLGTSEKRFANMVYNVIVKFMI